jgi:hypothetical protein
MSMLVTFQAPVKSGWLAVWARAMSGIASIVAIKKIVTR